MQKTAAVKNPAQSMTTALKNSGRGRRPGKNKAAAAYAAAENAHAHHKRRSAGDNGKATDSVSGATDSSGGK